MKGIEILGVKFNSVHKKNAIDLLEQFLYSSTGHTVFTPNPEFLVKAHHDPYFKKVLNSSDLNICDGAGTQIASRGKLQRITGVDFMMDLCALAERDKKSVYIIGALYIPKKMKESTVVIEKTQQILKNIFPHLKIVGWHPGPKIIERKDGSLDLPISDNQKILDDIQQKKPDILLVAFGMGKQEKWIYENLDKLPSVRIAMGVGGSFDFISGCIPRAPKWMRKVGFEWLFRFVQEPKRFLRIWNAVVVFPLLIFKEDLKKKIDPVQ
jgi:N-acetylglucosaminyldiphosphoundecaprenol N-acetyl-beta-D-mannosaminyltransferase